MDWIGVVTNAGKALLGAWAGGGTLELTGAAEGSGTVSAAALLAQTALASQKKTISIIKSTNVANGKKVKLRITSVDVTTAHTCNQIGVWARLNTGSPVMIAILQSATGQPIPTYAEVPDFVWDFYAILQMSNEGAFALTVDTSAVATINDIEELCQHVDEGIEAVDQRVDGVVENLSEVSVAANKGLDYAAGAITGIDLTGAGYTIAEADYYKHTLFVVRGSRNAAIIGPTSGNHAYLVINQDDTLPVYVRKPGGGSYDGAVIPPSSSAIVVYNGSQYILASAEQGRNLLINSNFDIWQRGTSLSFASTLWNQAKYLADRWMCKHGGVAGSFSRQAFTVGQSDVPNNPEYFARINVTSKAAAGDGGDLSNFTLCQRIENVRTMAGKKVALAFWAKASSTSGRLWVTCKQNFGSGGSAEVTAAIQMLFLTASWALYVVTFVVPEISGKTVGANSYLEINLHAFGGASSEFNTGTGWQTGTVDIAQIDFYEGSVARPYVPKSIAEDLRDCLRYYEKSFRYETVPAEGLGLSAGVVFATAIGAGYFALPPVFFKQPKRTQTPTITLFNPNGANVNKIGYGGGGVPAQVLILSEWGFTARVNNSPVVTGSDVFTSWTCSDEL